MAFTPPTQDHSKGRTCTKCGLFKTPDAFTVNIRYDGSFRLRSICRACGNCLKTERTEPKLCPGCNTVKPPEAFGGKARRSYCRQCMNAQSYEYRRGTGRDAHNKRMGEYQKNKYQTDPVFRLKVAARSAVRLALLKGTRVRPTVCSKCFLPRRLQAHHHNGYEKEHHLDIIWICAKCHRAEDFPDDPIRRDERAAK